MDLNELLNVLEDTTATLAEAIGDGRLHLDAGQKQMLSEAEVRVAQVRHELVDFDLVIGPEPYTHD